MVLSTVSAVHSCTKRQENFCAFFRQKNPAPPEFSAAACNDALHEEKYISEFFCQPLIGSLNASDLFRHNIQILFIINLDKVFSLASGQLKFFYNLFYYFLLWHFPVICSFYQGGNTDFFPCISPPECRSFLRLCIPKVFEHFSGIMITDKSNSYILRRDFHYFLCIRLIDTGICTFSSSSASSIRRSTPNPGCHCTFPSLISLSFHYSTQKHGIAI